MEIPDLKHKLCNFYKETFPEYQNTEITQLTDITSGWENQLISFDLSYKIQGKQIKKELIARIYPATDAKTKSAKEFTLVKKLHDLNYPVPRTYLLENSGNIIGNPFVILERINGPTMGEVIENTQEKKRNKLTNQFIDLYLQLHDLNWREFDLITLPLESPSFHSYIATLLNEYITSVIKRGLTDFHEVFDYLKNQMERLDISSLSLVHLDYHPNNILMKKNTYPVVIDWGTANILDFRFDLAWTVLLANAHYSQTLGQLVFESYQQKLGRTIEDFEFFYMFAATRRLIDYVISMTQGAETSGMRPETSMMLKQYNQAYHFVYDILRNHLDVRIGIIEEFLSR